MRWKDYGNDLQSYGTLQLLKSKIYNFLIVGDSGSGKTRLLKALCRERYNVSAHLRTKLLDEKTIECFKNPSYENCWSDQWLWNFTPNQQQDNRKIRFFDIGGEEKYEYLYEDILKLIYFSGVIIVVDGRSSLDAISKSFLKWRKRVHDATPHQNQTPIFVLVTHNNSLYRPSTTTIKEQQKKICKEITERKCLDFIDFSESYSLNECSKQFKETLNVVCEWIDDQVDKFAEIFLLKPDIVLEKLEELDSKYVIKLENKTEYNLCKSFMFCFDTEKTDIIKSTVQNTDSKSYYFACNEYFFILIMRFIHDPVSMIQEQLDYYQLSLRTLTLYNEFWNKFILQHPDKTIYDFLILLEKLLMEILYDLNNNVGEEKVTEQLRNLYRDLTNDSSRTFEFSKLTITIKDSQISEVEINSLSRLFRKAAMMKAELKSVYFSTFSCRHEIDRVSETRKFFLSILDYSLIDISFLAKNLNSQPSLYTDCINELSKIVVELSNIYSYFTTKTQSHFQKGNIYRIDHLNSDRNGFDLNEF